MSEISKYHREKLKQLIEYVQQTQGNEEQILDVLKLDMDEILAHHEQGLQLIENAIRLIHNIVPILESKQNQWLIEHSNDQQLIEQYKQRWDVSYPAYIEDPHVQYLPEDDEAIRKEFYEMQLKVLNSSLDKQSYEHEQLIQKAKLDNDRLIEIGNFHLIAYRELESELNKQRFEKIYNMSSEVQDIDTAFADHVASNKTFFFGGGNKSNENTQVGDALQKSFDMFYRAEYWSELEKTIQQQIFKGDYGEAQENIQKFYPSLHHMVAQQIKLAEHQFTTGHPDAKENLQQAVTYMSLGQSDPSEISLKFGDWSEHSLQEQERSDIQKHNLSRLEQLKHISALDKEVANESIQSVAATLVISEIEEHGNQSILELCRIAEFQYLADDPVYRETLQRIGTKLAKFQHYKPENHFTLVQFLYKCGEDWQSQVEESRKQFESTQQLNYASRALEELGGFVEQSMLLYDVLGDAEEKQEFLDQLIEFVDSNTGNIASHADINEIHIDTGYHESEYTNFSSYTHFKIYQPIITNLYALGNLEVAKKLEAQTGMSLAQDRGAQSVMDEHRYGIRSRKTPPQITTENLQQHLDTFERLRQRFQESTSVYDAENSYLDLANYGFRLGVFLLQSNKQLLGAKYIKLLESSHEVIE